MTTETATARAASLLTLDTAAQDLLFREAHTGNEFADKPVTDEQVQVVYELVKFAADVDEPAADAYRAAALARIISSCMDLIAQTGNEPRRTCHWVSLR